MSIRWLETHIWRALCLCFHFCDGTAPAVRLRDGRYGSYLHAGSSMSDACEFEVFSRRGGGEIFFQSMIGIDGARSGAWTL